MENELAHISHGSFLVTVSKGEPSMKFCYIDESGNGSEPYLIMVGIIVAAARRHKTKADWQDVVGFLSDILKRKITELHAMRFYRGLRKWRTLKGGVRSRTISAILQ